MERKLVVGYDLLAQYIRKLFDLGYRFDEIMAIVDDEIDTDMSILDVDILIENNDYEEENNLGKLIRIITLLDNYLFELFTSWQRSKFDDFIDHIRIDGLNSQENRQQTNLLLIPKYQCC